MNFFKSLNRYEHYGKARNYLYTIAGNLCKNSYKQKLELALEDLDQVTDSIENDIDKKLDMNSSLMKLPLELREVIVLYYFQDFKLKEIAVILEIGLPLVKYRLAKAKEKLKVIFLEEDNQWM